jgi:hypothetical protein
MKKYGSPQMMPSAAKAPQPRQLTGNAFLSVELQLKPSANPTRDRLKVRR